MSNKIVGTNTSTNTGLEYTAGEAISTEDIENGGTKVESLTVSPIVFKGYEDFGKGPTGRRPQAETQTYSVATDVNIHNYVDTCLRTESTDFESISERLAVENTIRLNHAAAGMTTEAGEFMDIVKKHIYYGKEIDRVHAIKELGDLLWYLAIAADVLEVPFEEILQVNIQKLRDRYPEKFTEDRALNRKQGDI